MKKKIRHLFFIIVVFISLSCFGQKEDFFYQSPSIDSLDVNKIFLEIENLNFFKDNEFASEKISGYTLPGFRIIPKLSFSLDQNIHLEAGFSLLHFWGTNSYPCLSYTDIPVWKGDDYQKGFHLLPFFRAQIELIENLNLVFGNLYINNNHNLILPLYNSELNLSSDPEAGIQLLFNSKYFISDLWFNWQSFIYKNDNHQEVFSFGYSTKTNILKPNSKFQIYFPFQFVAQHKGGEIDTLSADLLQTWTNYAGGIGVNYKIDKLIDNISFDIYYAGFIQNIGSSIPFESGNGIYPKLSISSNNLNLSVAYWKSKDFVSIFGSPNFINLSLATENMYFNEISIIHSKLEYIYKKKKNYSLGFEVDCFYYFPFSGYRTGYGEIYSSDYAEFSFGLYLKLNPKFRLYSLKE
ncbi:MAG: hypothetical protein PHD62_02340 [Bacteroidales bacterium]|nr:hypothetical protein [Bacteroidales bacterium]